MSRKHAGVPTRPLHFPTWSLELPAWVEQVIRPGDVVADRAARMRLAIRLAAENIAQETGGPFGAAVFERDSGRVVSAGVNLVVPSGCSLRTPRRWPWRWRSAHSEHTTCPRPGSRQRSWSVAPSRAASVTA